MGSFWCKYNSYLIFSERNLEYILTLSLYNLLQFTITWKSLKLKCTQQPAQTTARSEIFMVNWLNFFFIFSWRVSACSARPSEFYLKFPDIKCVHLSLYFQFPLGQVFTFQFLIMEDETDNCNKTFFLTASLDLAALATCRLGLADFLRSMHPALVCDGRQQVLHLTTLR